MASRELPLAGKSAVVTAGGGAIGSATAGVLVRDGAHVLVAARTEEKMRRVVEKHTPVAKEAGGSIGYRVPNGLDEDDIRALVEAGAEGTGRLDIAVNVVGGGGGGT